MENQSNIVAIDLGSSHVVVAVGHPAPDGRIVIDGIVSRESKGVVRGEVKNVEQAAQSLKEALTEIEQKLGISISSAYSSVSGSHIKCAKHPYYVYIENKDGEIVEADVRKLNESMRNVQAPEGYRLMHIIPQKYIVNDDEEVANPVGMFGKTLGSTFNLIIGEKNIMQRLEKALKRIGLDSTGAYINPLAMAEAVTFPDEKELGVAVVDIGSGTTDICIYQDGIVRYVGVVPLGTESVNRDIRSYGIMERYVEELKVKYGSAMAELVDEEKRVKVPGRTPNDHKEISFRDLAAIIEARMTDIADYVVEEIKASGYEGKLSAGLILTGGGALLKDVKELFEKRSGLDVRIAVPEILVGQESAEAVADPRFAAVVGLLHKAASEGKYSIVTAAATTGAPTAESQPAHDSRAQEDDDDLLEENRGRSRRTREPREPREPRKSIFSKLKERFEKTFDFDVLDDDDTL